MVFDLDDIDAAFADSMRVTSPAKRPPTRTHGRLVKEAYAAFNRREFPPTTSDWVNIDHRRGTSFAPGDMIPYIRAMWDVAPDINIHIEAVHRLSDLGAVVTHAARAPRKRASTPSGERSSLLTFDR